MAPRARCKQMYKHAWKKATSSLEKLRRDARLAWGVIMTGSHARTKEIEANKKLFQAWRAANYQFAKAQFGKENIAHFTVHRDEKTSQKAYKAQLGPFRPKGPSR